MDPTGYESKGLPKIECDTVISRQTYSIKDGDDTEYNKLLEEFQSYLEADCHAMVVDNEILFNYYENNSTKSMKNFLLEMMLREKLCDEPRMLTREILNREKDSFIILYMFGKSPMFVVTDFRKGVKEVEMVMYASKKYVDKYGDGYLHL